MSVNHTQNSSDGIKECVIAIVAQQAMIDVSDVSVDQSLEDLGIDSLGLVESIFALEEAFDISVPFNSNDPSDTQFDIQAIEQLVSAQSA
jgi:acyl carrier protein